MKYVIKKDSKFMLSGVGLGTHASINTVTGTNWTVNTQDAIPFNKEEAEATIEFITNVIDWELGEKLFWEEIN